MPGLESLGEIGSRACGRVLGMCISPAGEAYLPTPFRVEACPQIPPSPDHSYLSHMGDDTAAVFIFC